MTYSKARLEYGSSTPNKAILYDNVVRLRSICLVQTSIIFVYYYRTKLRFLQDEEWLSNMGRGCNLFRPFNFLALVLAVAGRD